MGLEFRLIKLLQRCCFGLIALWCGLATAYDEGANFLIGLSAGYARHTGPLDIGIVYNIPQFQQNLFVNGNGDDWNKGIFVGYRWICNGWILDGEFNIDLYQQERDFYFIFPPQQLSPYEAKRRYKHGPAFGITGRWGYTMAPYFLPYIVVGFETNKDKLEVTIEGNQAFFANPIVIYDAKQQVRGILGFGTEFPLVWWCDSLSLRLEYRYYGLDKVLNPRGVLTSNVGINPDFSMALRPKFNSLRAALLWNFL